jgi:hypothetical protein
MRATELTLEGPSPSSRVHAVGLPPFHGLADSPVALLRHPNGIDPISLYNSI